MNNKLPPGEEITKFTIKAIKAHLKVCGLNYDDVAQHHTVANNSPFIPISVLTHIEPQFADFHKYCLLNENLNWKNFIINYVEKSIGEPFNTKVFQSLITRETQPLNKKIDDLKIKVGELERQVIEKDAVINHITKEDNKY